MKKLILTLSIVAFAAGMATAQINQGTILVGGSSSFGVNGHNPDGGSSYSTLDLDLKGGYFIIENLALGLNLQFSKFSSDNSSSSSTTVGIFGRYYIIGKIFAGVGLNSTSSSGSSSSSTSVPIEVGYAAFINPNIAIEPSLNFVSSTGTDSFGLNLGISLYFNRE